MSYRLLLCDADETLFDFGKSERNAISETFQSFGIPDTEELRATYHAANMAQWKRLERGETTQKRLRVARFEDFLALIGKSGDPQAMSDKFVESLARQGFALQGAEEFCAAVSARIPIIIVTNGISEVQRGRLAHSPLRRYLSGMVVSEELGVSKPDPRIAEEALRLAGCTDRSGAVLMGDSVTADIPCALNAGIDSILFAPDGGAPDGHGATYTVKTYDEALRLILD